MQGAEGGVGRGCGWRRVRPHVHAVDGRRAVRVGVVRLEAGQRQEGRVEVPDAYDARQRGAAHGVGQQAAIDQQRHPRPALSDRSFTQFSCGPERRRAIPVQLAAEGTSQSDPLLPRKGSLLPAT